MQSRASSARSRLRPSRRRLEACLQICTALLLTQHRPRVQIIQSNPRLRPIPTPANQLDVPQPGAASLPQRCLGPVGFLCCPRPLSSCSSSAKQASDETLGQANRTRTSIRELGGLFKERRASPTWIVTAASLASPAHFTSQNASLVQTLITNHTSETHALCEGKAFSGPLQPVSPGLIALLDPRSGGHEPARTDTPPCRDIPPAIPPMFKAKPIILLCMHCISIANSLLS